MCRCPATARAEQKFHSMPAPLVTARRRILASSGDRAQTYVYPVHVYSERRRVKTTYGTRFGNNTALASHTVLDGSHHQLADILLENSSTLVSGFEALEGIVDRLRHLITPAKLDPRWNSTLRRKERVELKKWAHS